MSYSVSEITCSNCGNQFHGFLRDLFDISKQYAATCPKCESQTFFTGKAAFIDMDVADNYVEIMYVAQL